MKTIETVTTMKPASRESCELFSKFETSLLFRQAGKLGKRRQRNRHYADSEFIKHKVFL